MINERITDSRVSGFVQNLATLDPGDRARFKRNVGCTLGEARNVTALFYRLLPPGAPSYQEETYFMVATLYPLADAGSTGSFGTSLSRARTTKNAKGLDRRVEALLDADADQLPFRLRQSVHFLQSNRVRIDWAGLLKDLLSWSHPDRFIQNHWAKDYFKKNPEKEN